MAIELHHQVTGSRPQGWYTGRCSEHTVDLVCEAGGFSYISDSYADDLPYWIKVKNKKHLIIPYTLDNNDMRFSTLQGFNTGEDFYNYLKNSFDTLYREANEFNKPKMMSVGLHCRLIARPGRFMSLVKFLNYVSGYNDIWICKREEIANYWYENFSDEN